MADPAELIAKHEAAVFEWSRALINSNAEPERTQVNHFAAALLAALTPAATPASAEDAAVLMAFQAAAIDAYTQHDGPSELDAKREQLRAAVLARMAGKVPTGWKLVPVEPTEAMFNAVIDLGGRASFEEEYRAAVAAAPESPR